MYYSDWLCLSPSLSLSLSLPPLSLPISLTLSLPLSLSLSLSLIPPSLPPSVPAFTFTHQLNSLTHSSTHSTRYLLPEKSTKSKQKTQVVKRNCNPEWNHTFVFEDVSWEELRERAMELTVWDHDRFTSNDFLGGVRLGLGKGSKTMAPKYSY